MTTYLTARHSPQQQEHLIPTAAQQLGFGIRTSTPSLPECQAARSNWTVQHQNGADRASPTLGGWLHKVTVTVVMLSGFKGLASDKILMSLESLEVRTKGI